MAAILLKKLHPNAQMPTQGSPFSAGFDLYSVDSGKIHSNTGELIPTGIAIEMGSIAGGLMRQGLIWPRSGLAVRNDIAVMAGVIDNDYRGEICVKLFNHGREPLHYQTGDRIAQILFQLVIADVEFLEVDELTDSDRGEGGFGSSGR